MEKEIAGDKRGVRERQTGQYDKVLKENLEVMLPELLKNILDINAILTKALPNDVQHTKERKPDVLKLVSDDKGENFVLHVEFQLADEKEMVLRMIEYWVMLSRKHKLPVRQYVIYIGEGNPVRMKDHLHLEPIDFHYHLISLSGIDYKLLLKSDKPEVKLLSTLADFGKENPRKVLDNIVAQIIEVSNSDFDQNRYLQQLRILAQLRSFITEILPSMDSIAKFISEEKDFLYIRGEMKGVEKGKETFVRYLLLNTDFPIAKIASEADVSEAFVQKVKDSLM